MPRARLPLPKGVPRTLRFQSVAFDLSALADGRLAFAYYDGSRRVVVKRQTLDELRTDAERIAVAILNADTAAQQMSTDDTRIFVAARDVLAPHGLSLDQAARILADAARHVGGADRIVEACRWFGQNQRGVRQATTLEVVQHFIRNLRSDELDADYIAPMEKDLGKFAAKFPGSFAAITTNGIDDYLRGLGVGLRRRRNLRGELVTLFNFAVEQGYLPENIKTAAERVKRPKVARKAPSLYTPEELDLLIQQCHQPADQRVHRKDYHAFLPALLVAAFAGLRWEEILGLEWSDVHFEDGVIEVGEENKTGFRLVPMQPNLSAWLAEYRTARGWVCPARNRKAISNFVRRLRRRAGLSREARRYANAFRHSFVTYRVAVTKNMPQVAGESGHTVAELRRSYNRASLESVGLKWFGIFPSAPANVTQMPLMSFGGKTVPNLFQKTPAVSEG